MLIRSLVLALALGGVGTLALTSCSGRPENSPAVRKKFAEVDQMQNQVEEMVADLRIMTDQVRRLTEENSELRAFLPDVDGESAVAKLTSLDERLQRLEAGGVARTGNAGAATSENATQTSNESAPRNTAPRQDDLDEAPLATNQPDRAVASSSGSGAARQPGSSAPADNFRNMTNQIASQREAPAPRQQQASGQTTQQAAPAPQRQQAAPSASRGRYHTIEQGETIQSIAERYNTTPDALLQANRLPQGARLARGQRLYVPGQ